MPVNTRIEKYTDPVTLNSFNLNPSLSKKIFSASIQLTASRASVRLLSLVTMPILTHLLTPSAYGVVAMAGTLVSLLSVFALAGMDMSYMRSFNDDSGASFEQVEIFAWQYTLIAGTIAAVLLTLAWPFFSKAFALANYLGPLIGIGVLIALANTMAQTRARLHGRYRMLSIAIIASGIGAAAVSIGIASWWRRDELALLLSMLASYLIPALILGLPNLAIMIKPSGLTTPECKAVMKIGLAGIVTAPAYWLISSSDRWLLGYYEGADSVGIYSVGYNVAIMGMMISNAIHAVWTPETVNEFKNNPDSAPARLGQTSEKIICSFACVCLAVVAAGGDTIRLLTAPAFHDSAHIVPFVAIAVFFHGITHLANASLLLMKRLKYSMWCWLAGGLICLGCNLLFIPWIGRTGAALTQTISMMFIAGSISWFAQRVYPLQINWLRLTPTLAILFLCGSAMAPAWSKHALISLTCKLPVGIAIVSCVVFCHAPTMLSTLGNRLNLISRRIF